MKLTGKLCPAGKETGKLEGDHETVTIKWQIADTQINAERTAPGFLCAVSNHDR